MCKLNFWFNLFAFIPWIVSLRKQAKSLMEKKRTFNFANYRHRNMVCRLFPVEIHCWE